MALFGVLHVRRTALPTLQPLLRVLHQIEGGGGGDTCWSGSPRARRGGDGGHGGEARGVKVVVVVLGEEEEAQEVEEKVPSGGLGEGGEAGEDLESGFLDWGEGRSGDRKTLLSKIRRSAGRVLV